MPSTLLRRALTEPGRPPLRQLPEPAAALLEQLSAPPRLAAHLRAVHDVAYQLTDWIQQHHPELTFDRTAALFGAAVHDIGKIIHVAELSGPGSAHEQAGCELLVTQGIPAELARFCRTHGSWTLPGIAMEDLLVSLADKVWKAKRVPDLEQLVVERLAAASGSEPWQVFLDLDDHLNSLAADADDRLAFQTGYPIAA